MDKKVSTIGTELEVLKLYSGDYNLKLHVREIARLLKVNHRTASIALKRLEYKSIMKHQNVGKSKQYFLNIDNFLTKDYIKNAELVKLMRFLEIHFTLKKLLGELRTVMKDTPIILFGSYAKGKETKESDIDILLIKTKEEKQITKKINDFSKLYKINIQMQKSSHKDFEDGIKEKDNLIIEIIKGHIILNNVEFFVDILWRYYGR